MTKHVIAFQNRILVVPNAGVDNRSMAMTTQAELMKFGFMLDSYALAALGAADAADIKNFYREVIDYLKEIMGGARSYQPIYPGFPQQVMDMTEYELWRNQLIGYWTGGSFNAPPELEPRKAAFEHVEYKMIGLGSEANFNSIFNQLLKSGTSITPADMEVVKWFIKNHSPLTFPDSIPFKENLCTVLQTMYSLGRDLNTVSFSKLTTIDVLRVAVAMSGGDISLPAVPPKFVPPKLIKNRGWGSSTLVKNSERNAFKFKKFKRGERKFILELLEKSNLDIRDMKLKDQRWIRLGEILHPGEYKLQYPKTFNAFNMIRNEKVTSWYGQVQGAFNQSFEVGLAKLAERPGEFLRRLDWLIRTNGTRVQAILDVLSRIGIGASNKVLLEVYTHFEGRENPTVGRRVMIKGARKHTPLPELPGISKEKIVAIQATIFDIIKAKLAGLPEMGDCWIDEELKKIPLPTNMRSMSESLVPIVRGQRTPFNTDKKVIRSFIHWFDKYGEEDFDLHGFLIGNSKPISFGYSGIKNSVLGCYSGDVRHRKGACAEYVDIVVDKAMAEGYQYYIMVVNNYSGDKFSDVAECFAGVEGREFPEANELWLPSTIQNCMRVNSPSKMTMVAAYDLVAHEYIHLDLDYDLFEGYVHSGKSNELFNAIAPYIAAPKVSVYDLLSWHVEARGRIVSKEAASTHFLYEDFSSSYTKTLEWLGV